MPRADGAPLWRFRDTFSLDSENGIWQSIIAPELKRKMESQMIASALGKSKPDLNLDAKNTNASDGGKPAYQTGKRLRANEQEASRKNAPVSKSTGSPLRWGL